MSNIPRLIIDGYFIEVRPSTWPWRYDARIVRTLHWQRPDGSPTQPFTDHVWPRNERAPLSDHWIHGRDRDRLHRRCERQLAKMRKEQDRQRAVERVAA